MSTVLELGIKEGQRATWRSWGIAIITNAGGVTFGVYLVLPLAMRLKLVLVSPCPYFLGVSLTKWSWLEIRFNWYRFIGIEVALPLWRRSNRNKRYGSGGKEI